MRHHCERSGVLMRRRTVLLEHEKQVPHGFVVAVQDASKTARMERVLFLLPSKKKAS